MQDPSREEIQDSISELKEMGYNKEMFRNIFHPVKVGGNVKITTQFFGPDSHSPREVLLLRNLYYGMIQGNHSKIIFQNFGEF